MCDDFTQIADEAALSRRQFGLIGAAATVVAGSAGSVLAATGSALSESMVSVTTPDGVADAFFVRPAKGKHPAAQLLETTRMRERVMVSRRAGAWWERSSPGSV